MGARSIAYTDSDGKLRLNLDSLHDILMKPEIQNKKLVVVSIVGELRKAKSFISGFPIRYLQNHGWKKESWMGDAGTQIDGFRWGPGTERNTIGIDLWEEPFIIEDENGEEVVVLLLDTQGLFDFETTMTNNVRINAICMLASSLMIMNFQGQITERDLQNWQLSADFAKVSSSVDDTVFELPRLLVLVQNWTNTSDYAFGVNGGKAYIDYALADRPNKAALNEVRQNIRSSFPRTASYLMPHPGLNVTSDTFRGSNGEMTDVYLQYVKMYVEYLFNPANLAIKQLQGQPMNAKSYYNLLVSVDRAMSSDEIPTVQNLGEALARLLYSSAHEKCLDMFVLNMRRRVDQEVIIGREELEELYDFEKENSMQRYETAKSIGSQELRKEYRTKLVEDMEDRKRSLDTEMDVKRNMHVVQIAEEIYKDFTENLDKISNRNPTNLDMLQQSYCELKNHSAGAYDNRLSHCEPHATEFRSRFLEQIDRYFERSQVVMRERIEAEIEMQRIQGEKERAEAERRNAEERARQEAENRRKAEERAQKAIAEKKAAEERERRARSKKKKYSFHVRLGF